MLQNINRLGKSWVGRVVVTILFGFLIMSFAIWGIGDIFRGGVRTQVATVAGRDITAESYRQAYQNEYQNLIRRARQSITPDQARALGLDRQVLARLVTEAALDDRAQKLGLAVPDALVVGAIQDDPSFKGPSGQFDRALFTDTLRSSGVTEGQYVRDQKSVAARLQIAEAVSGALPVPLAMREAVHRYQTEKRAAEYALLTPAAAGDIPAPDEAQLKSFFEERKALYRAPEYRAVGLLVLDAASLAKPDAVSDADARAAYERLKDSRFGTSERRTVEQIVFPTVEEANAASARIKAGTPFAEIAKERNVDAGTLSLGTVTRSEILDPAVAEAAFRLADNGVSDTVAGRFGPVLVHVTAIQPGAVRPYEAVAAEVKTELATERARAEVQRIHDEIEDQRAAAKPLDQIATERGIPLRRIASLDRQGRDKAGQLVTTVPDPQAVVPALFRAEVGADTEALRLPDGSYVWYDVTGIEPARDRTLDEVRDRVSAEWRTEEVAKRLADRAKALREAVEGGASFESVAAQVGGAVARADDLTRTGTGGPLPRPVVTRIFATPTGKVADAASDDGRVLFRVTAATVPPYVTTTQEAERVAEQLRQALADDLLGEYFAMVEKEIGVQTYPDAMRRAIGGDS